MSIPEERVEWLCWHLLDAAKDLRGIAMVDPSAMATGRENLAEAADIIIELLIKMRERNAA